MIKKIRFNSCGSMLLQCSAKSYNISASNVISMRCSSSRESSRVSPNKINRKLFELSYYNLIFNGSRTYSTENKTSQQFPNIMNFPVFIWPNIFKTIKNWILSNLIISRYFDKEFSLPDFVAGSKKAVDVVSHYIAKGDLKSLEGLVSPEAIEEVRNHLYNFSLRQQSELAICRDDIFLSFPYEVGIMFEDSNGSAPQRRYVEITMCYHVLSGLRELRDSADSPPINFNALPEFQQKMFIVNYRFFRDFTEGVKPNWIINGFNHVKPVSEV